ncbi:MAG: hypothetical protein AAFP03_00540 [Cyanobacteria bacterium J06598_3]
MFRFFRRLFRLFRRRRRPDPVSPLTPSPSAASGTSSSPAKSSLPANSVSPDSPSPNSPSSEPSAIANPPGRSNLTQPRGASGAASSSLSNLKQVLNVLRAYVVTFGQPGTELELRSVIGAISANLTTVNIENSQLETFMDEAIAAFRSLGADASLVDVSAQLLAEQVAVWLREQEATVGNVVSAYLQQFAPDDARWDSGEIVGLVQTIIATLNDGSLSRSGGKVLVDRVINAFDLDQALSRWVAPEWVALAQRVANFVDHGDLQSELRSIAWSYIQQFQTILSPQLIEQIATSGPLTVSPTEFFSGDLSEFSQMLFYKFQLLDADPVVTKSHQAIAADVHKAVADLKAQRDPGLDVTAGIQTGDLEISSPFRRTGEG